MKSDVVIPDFAPGDWAAVERHLGVHLPDDYKSLIGDGRALTYDDELFIGSPFEPVPHFNLIRLVSEGSWAMAYLRDSLPDDFDTLIFPEPGGVLRWGWDSGGAEYHWDTTPEDPNAWTIFVSGRPVVERPGQRHACALTGYLDGLTDGTIEAAGLGEWPGLNPRIEPMTET